jgi:hypothetical protein
MITTSELGIKESFILNIASLIYYIDFRSKVNLLHSALKWVVSSMIKAILLEIHYSLSSREGKSLDRDGAFVFLTSLGL